VVAAEAVSEGLRSSPTVQITLIVLGAAPVVSSVAVASEPETLPALAL